jgi:hypothetical protein
MVVTGLVSTLTSSYVPMFFTRQQDEWVFYMKRQSEHIFIDQRRSSRVAKDRKENGKEK